ncbi:MAG TPA: carboxylesterase family protein [Myxococcota bacterium]
MQSPSSDDPGGTPMGSEDCLTLNVYEPAHASALLPVLFFIHGGFFTWGSSAMRQEGVDEYDGGYLATHANAVVVTINYRIGALGFFAHPALGGGSFGLQDQIAALAWVQRNGKQFHGDPSHVMIFGQSAGAISVAALVASPKSRGLFASAMVLSGSSYARPLALAQKEGVALGAALDCPGDDDKALACLRSKSGSAVVAAGALSFAPGGYTWGPTIDGDVLPMKPFDAFARGQQNRVPLIIGNTANEFSTMIRHYMKETPVDTPAHYEAAVKAWDPAALAHYPAASYASTVAAFTALFSDRAQVCPAQALAAVASKNQPVRRYVYSHAFESGPLAKYGAGHGFDLRLLFHASPASQLVLSPQEEQLSAAMIRYVARFAKTGDPNGGGDVAWPAYDPAKNSFLDFDTASIALGAGDRAEQCEYWNRAARPKPR